MTAAPERSIYVDDGPEERPLATVEVVVTGRNVTIPDHFRVHVNERLGRVERFDSAIHLINVELYHERNRRQAKNCQRVEITARRKGPVVRAEACAENFYAALEAAVTKLETRLRRSKERRRVSHGEKRPTSVAEATAPLADDHSDDEDFALTEISERYEQTAEDGPGQVVRTKEHSAIPMTVDDALYQMELVGHDFFLFHDKERGVPAVVYRRHAFDYGLITLV